MACDNQVGVKNILLTFRDCSTNQRVGPISHELAGDDLPTFKTCDYENEAMAGGYIKRVHSNAGAEMTIIRDRRIPLSFYQGCAEVSMQVEMQSGIVYTGNNGGVVGGDRSDSHEVTLELAFKVLDEMLPPGALVAA
jgi:hypothetical protein